MKSSALARISDRHVPLRTRTPLQGVHLLGEWYGCPRREPLRRANRLELVCKQLAKQAGFDILSAHFHQFEPQGAMGAVLMTNAHLAIHTWPDTGFVTVDLYACHLNPANRTRAQAVFDDLRACLRPVWVKFSEISRGVADGDAE